MTFRIFVAIFCAMALTAGGWLVWLIVADLSGRGEDDQPDMAEHADQAMAIVRAAERELVADVETYLRSIR